MRLARPGATGNVRYYSRPWAVAVFLIWAEEHPRATDISIEYTGKTQEDCIHWLQNGDRRWEIMKAVRKMALRVWFGRLQATEKYGESYYTSTPVEQIRLCVSTFWRDRCKSEGLDP